MRAVGILKMQSVKVHIFFLFYAYFACCDFIEKTSDNYGPYTVEWEHYYACRGPKLANLTSYTIALVKHSDSYRGSFNMTFLDQTRIENVKMAVYTMKGEQKILLWNYMIDKPCQHYVMSKVFESKVGAQNCVVKKGTYTCELNFTEMIRSYLGTSFFYGDFIFKVLVLSKRGNILCLVFNPVFKKKI